MPFTLSAGMPGGGTLNVEGQAGPLDPTDSAKSSTEDAKIKLDRR